MNFEPHRLIEIEEILNDPVFQAKVKLCKNKVETEKALLDELSEKKMPLRDTLEYVQNELQKLNEDIVYGSYEDEIHKDAENILYKLSSIVRISLDIYPKVIHGWIYYGPEK